MSEQKPQSTSQSSTYLAVVAGCSAALSSIFGKIAFDKDILPNILYYLQTILFSIPETFESYVLLILRGICVAMIFLTNVIMINLFVKSMEQSNTSDAVVVNTASNFFFTAFLGWCLFGEPIPPLWWIGAFFVIVGVIVILYGTPKQHIESEQSIQEESKKHR